MFHPTKSLTRLARLISKPKPTAEDVSSTKHQVWARLMEQEHTFRMNRPTLRDRFIAARPQLAFATATLGVAVVAGTLSYMTFGTTATKTNDPQHTTAIIIPTKTDIAFLNTPTPSPEATSGTPVATPMPVPTITPSVIPTPSSATPSSAQFALDSVFDPNLLNDPSSNSTGVSTGYEEVKTVSYGNIFVQAARAAADTYQTSLYYAKPLSDKSAIFKYSLRTQKETQVTDSSHWVAKPLYNSRYNLLAYTEYEGKVSDSPFQTVVIDLKAGIEKARIKGSGQYGFSMSWSPDGKRLAIFDLGNSNGRKVVIYSVDQNTASALQNPTNVYPDNSPFLRWRNSTSVFTSYSTYGGQGDGIYAVDLTNGTATQVPTAKTRANSIHTTEDTMYYLGPTPGEDVYNNSAYYQDVNADKAGPMIEGTEGSFDIIVGKPNSKNDRFLVLARVNATKSTRGIYRYDVATGTQKLLAPKFDGVNFIGWANNYTQLLYILSRSSGNYEIRMINTTNGQDQQVVSGLGWYN